MLISRSIFLSLGQFYSYLCFCADFRVVAGMGRISRLNFTSAGCDFHDIFIAGCCELMRLWCSCRIWCPERAEAEKRSRMFRIPKIKLKNEMNFAWINYTKLFVSHYFLRTQSHSKTNDAREKNGIQMCEKFTSWRWEFDTGPRVPQIIENASE